jgi:hypothetical protein
MRSPVLYRRPHGFRGTETVSMKLVIHRGRLWIQPAAFPVQYCNGLD